MSDMTMMDREFGWEDEIQRDDSPRQILPEGDYQFTVTKFERARHAGSERVPPCNKAVLTLAVRNAGGSGEVLENLFLHSKFEWNVLFGIPVIFSTSPMVFPMSRLPLMSAFPFSNLMLRPADMGCQVISGDRRQRAALMTERVIFARPSAGGGPCDGGCNSCEGTLEK